jgi:hypothetical protein
MRNAALCVVWVLSRRNAWQRNRLGVRMSRKSLSAPVQMLRRYSMMDIGEKPLGTTQTSHVR